MQVRHCLSFIPDTNRISIAIEHTFARIQLAICNGREEGKQLQNLTAIFISAVVNSSKSLVT